MSDEGDKRQRRGDPVAFPWFALLLGLAAIAFVLIATDPRLASFYALPDFLQGREAHYGVVAVLVLLAGLDVRRVRRRHETQRTELQQRQAQIDDLWARNKQLQLKAHTYSEHADKLKLFISDKLLEYIEYDEKFLHFKGIAAEVRHNGVISFDKVQTALQRQLTATDPASGSDTATGTAETDPQAALDALHYLWDLLDLSTAENLTLHIGNLMCECEEQYCQRLLDSDQARTLPDEPAYPPQRAAWRALAMVREEPLPALDPDTPYSLDDGRIHARLERCGELLGKENHLVLLLENLLRNAQFYAAKRGYSSQFAPIALTLSEEDGDVCLRVYNRGPHVREEDLPNLFQLGYSTRRKREHHGRGLGLYFVNEIVKGYEGRITVHNIDHPRYRYTLRMSLLNGKELIESVETVNENGRTRCRSAEGDTVRSREWTNPSPVTHIVIESDDGTGSVVLDEFSARGTQDFHDPAHPERPHWRLRYRPKRNAHRLEFMPLDITGVEFEVRLPTAQKRVDNAGAVIETDTIDGDIDPP
ncbi:ATP-binding protein [Halofilum ochraceum]|uniref:ATP-binding protein n=1 Tax=Halofilum ochraceum TaxID=1611323 RepID=UPI000831916C|nr:ATP-binding protein [Halofilum ochraceum]